MVVNHGIYKIKNLINEKFYIGSAVNLSKRKAQHYHYLRNNNHPNIHMQRSYNKHKEETFVFIIIEMIDNKEQLITREQYYIDTLKPEYNICPTAGSSLGRITSEKTKDRMRLNHSMRDSTHSKETKLKMSTIAKKSGRRPTKKAILNSAIIRSIPIIQLSLNDKFIREYSSTEEAKRDIGNLNITDVLKGRRKTSGGFKWKYKTAI